MADQYMFRNPGFYRQVDQELNQNGGMAGNAGASGENQNMANGNVTNAEGNMMGNGMNGAGGNAGAAGNTNMGANMAADQMNSEANTAQNDYGLTTPVAPEGGQPVYTGGGDYGLTTPIAPEGGQPVYPGNGDYGLTTPIAPEGGRPVFTGGSQGNTGLGGIIGGVIGGITGGNTGTTNYYGRVRFLNASTNSNTVNISIDGVDYAINSRFGTISNYDWVSDGFHTVTVRSASGLRTILLQQTFPFAAGERYTMVLIDSTAGGLEMIQVSNSGCSNIPYNSGCYRVANMTYMGTSYDVTLIGGDTIFRNVTYRTVTSYKQAVAGSYQFYITNSNTYQIIRELPVIVLGSYGNQGNILNPLTQIEVTIGAGRSYTSYMIGNTWSEYSFRVLTVED